MKYIFIAICMLVAMHSYGQEELNYNNAVGLGISFRSSDLGEIIDGKNRVITDYSISPTYFRRMSSRWSLGFGLSYARLIDRNSSFRTSSPAGPFIFSDDITNSFQLSLFGRYWVNPSSKLQFFLQPGISFNRSRSRTEDESGDVRNDNFNREISFGVSPGLAYQFSSRWRILTQLGQLRYSIFASKLSEEAEFERRSDTFEFNLSSRFIVFGLEYLF
ncbi:MAG: hypothetical protein AAF741_04025 [Bacteroidota bacterium]